MLYLLLDFCHLEYLEYCLHLTNVLFDISFSLLQVIHVKLGNLRIIPQWKFYLIYGSRLSNSVNHDKIQVLSYKYSLLSYWYLRLNLQLPDYFTQKHFLTKHLILCVMCPAEQSEWIFWTYKSNVSLNLWNSTYYYKRFFYLGSYHNFLFLIKPFWLLVPKWYSSLYLDCSVGHRGSTYMLLL